MNKLLLIAIVLNFFGLGIATEPAGYEAIAKKSLRISSESISGSDLNIVRGQRIVIASKGVGFVQLMAADGQIYKIDSSLIQVLRSFTFDELEKQAQFFAETQSIESETSVSDEFENEAKSLAHLYVRRVRQKSTSVLPPPASRPTESGLGTPEITIKNDTSYVLYVYYTGPKTVSVTIQPGASRRLELPAGTYGVVARSTQKSVNPFYGSRKMQEGYIYSSSFYIVTSRTRN